MLIRPKSCLVNPEFVCTHWVSHSHTLCDLALYNNHRVQPDDFLPVFVNTHYTWTLLRARGLETHPRLLPRELAEMWRSNMDTA